MAPITIRGIVKTSIVTAFTIAAALIWKDVFSEFIKVLFPQEMLLYKFIAAIVVTLFVILAIYVTLRTEHEAEKIFRVLKNMNKEKRKKIIKEIKKEEEKLKVQGKLKEPPKF